MVWYPSFDQPFPECPSNLDYSMQVPVPAFLAGVQINFLYIFEIWLFFCEGTGRETFGKMYCSGVTKLELFSLKA